jgi:hypothetical protein
MFHGCLRGTDPQDWEGQRISWRVLMWSPTRCNREWCVNALGATASAATAGVTSILANTCAALSRQPQPPVYASGSSGRTNFHPFIMQSFMLAGTTLRPLLSLRTVCQCPWSRQCKHRTQQRTGSGSTTTGKGRDFLEPRTRAGADVTRACSGRYSLHLVFVSHIHIVFSDGTACRCRLQEAPAGEGS